jgi:REP element-mobilizing transposase RayT
VEFEARQGYFLPHWRSSHATYHVVFRQADSLPSSVLLEFRSKFAEDELPEEVAKYLDAGYGSCACRDNRCAEEVQSAIMFFDGSRYDLIAWAVMPNHTHAVVRPFKGYELSDITHSWKSFSANRINRILGRTGTLWHKESFDRIIRDKEEFEVVVRYVLDNPRKARLRHWRWCGAKRSREH